MMNFFRTCTIDFKGQYALFFAAAYTLLGEHVSLHFVHRMLYIAVKEKKVDNAAGEATATPQLAAELAAVMEREVALRKEMVTLHKKKQENVVAMRRQFLTLFRWKVRCCLAQAQGWGKGKQNRDGGSTAFGFWTLTYGWTVGNTPHNICITGSSFKPPRKSILGTEPQCVPPTSVQHGMQRTAEDGDEAPASIVHARTVADLCGQAEAQLSAQLAALQQQLATAAEQFRFLVNRIPEVFPHKMPMCLLEPLGMH